MIQKTKFSSYCLNNIADGCKFCVKGEKIVLFISGLCNVNCYYCSLSSKRKNIDKVWANERICKSKKDLIEEVKESNAKGAGITGGDPFLVLNRTLKYAKILKQKFGKNFHIHIYLPTKHVSLEKLEKLSRYVDEVRFHPEFLINKGRLSEKEFNKDIEKIRLAGFFWNKAEIGVELPLIPDTENKFSVSKKSKTKQDFSDKKKEILDFILGIKDYVGFVNLNELEVSDVNLAYMVRKYKFKEGGYVTAGSKEAGLWILRELVRKKVKLKIHLCTADLKNQYQYKNRLLRHKILPYGKKTEDGTVVYLVANYKNNKERIEIKKQLKGKKIYFDKIKKRIILSEQAARKLVGKGKIFRVEEFPSYDRIEVEKEEI